MSIASTAERPVGSGGRFRRFVGGLDRADRRSLVGMLGFIVVLHVVGFGVLFGLVMPEHYQLGGATPDL